MPGIIDIKLATPADAIAIRALTRSAYAKWVPVVGREPVPMTVDYEQALRRHRFDLLNFDGALSGLIETLQLPDHLWIENIAVLPDHQGKGLGRRLLDHAECLAIEAGLGEMRLLTNAAFASNVELYKRVGYRIDRLEPFRDGGTTVYMSKKLTRQA
ncbi:MAG: hypothetical protein K0S54_2700 [Alphaproteobacteria bacterium]|jgi:GNAT superfamily N-acetyltransferase|nr:hypothetical protein [Alphaproteobacteria bacterium]